jgi:hypothetical protein
MLTLHLLDHSKSPAAPKNNNKILLHAPGGRLITKMTKAILQKLNALYNHANDKPTLPEALAELTHRHTTINITHDQIIENKLHKHYKPQPQQDLNGAWPIPDVLYDALNNRSNVQRVIHSNPINLPLRSKTYISHDPKDACFGAIPYIKTAWPGSSLALPYYTPIKLKQAREQALYNAHAHRHASPSKHILLLPNWGHSPYLARNLHTAHILKLTSISFYPTHTPTPTTRNPIHNVYLVSNEKVLALLDRTHILTTLHTAITKLTRRISPAISLNLCKQDPQHIDNHTTYTDPCPNIHNPIHRPPKNPT